MFLYDLHHRTKLNKFFSSDFRLFEISIWLHVFGRSLVAIFIPIILLDIGYPIGEVMIYFFIYHLIDVPLNFLAKKLIEKNGARKVIILGIFFSIIYFFGVFNLTTGNWPLLVTIALFSALYDSFYWVAHIYYFMQTSKNDEDVSKDVSLMYIVKKVAGILAPIIGAGILIFWGQKILLLFSIAVLILSIIPLFYFKHALDKPEKVMSFRKFFNDWNTVKDYIYAGIYAIHLTVEFIIWPMFIYVIFANIESVAFLPVIISITTVIFAYFSGKIKKENRYQGMVIGGIFIALIWILRIWAQESWMYYLSVFLVSLFSILITLPLDSNVFEKGEKKDALVAATSRNAVNMFTRMIIYGFLALAVNIFNVGFITAALAMFSLVLFIFIGGDIRKRKVSLEYV